MPHKPTKRLWLIALYMAFIFCVVIVMAKYAERHPIEDVRRSSEAIQTD